MRVLALDVGRRRIGLALSDTSATLARPYKTLTVTSANAVDQVVTEVQRLISDEDGLDVIVVGLPRHLDGRPSEQTVAVQRFIDDLRALISIPLFTEDERLSSREAESRLAVRERDWKKR